MKSAVEINKYYKHKYNIKQAYIKRTKLIISITTNNKLTYKNKTRIEE